MKAQDSLEILWVYDPKAVGGLVERETKPLKKLTAVLTTADGITAEIFF